MRLSNCRERLALPEEGEMHITTALGSDRKPRLYLTPENQAETLLAAQVREELTLRGVAFDTEIANDDETTTVIVLAKQA
jgi:hypothetical protein